MSFNLWMKSLCFFFGSLLMVLLIIYLEGFDWIRRMIFWMLLLLVFNCIILDFNGVFEEKDFNMLCMLNELIGCNFLLL